MLRRRLKLSTCCLGGALLALTTAARLGHESDAAEDATTPLRIDKPLLAYWSFDEAFGQKSRDTSGNDCDASPARSNAPGFERTDGVFGGALNFTGRHLLRIPEKLSFGTRDQIALSVWVMPTEWETYNEIFRKEDGDNRVLFSFQGTGTILSLGLNVGGYLECDATIDPQQLLDGDWHHCAATFDGQFMRVYLDGEEIGSAERPGTITAGGLAPACIGSSNGGECFQGTMDDLAIYGEALTAEEVANIHQRGRDALKQMTNCLPADEPTIDGVPALAHWTFNEGAVASAQEASGKAGRTARAERRLPRMRGVHGNALNLRGEHALKTDLGLPGGEMAAVSFAAWARPTDLGGNRELFRQECGERLLFSFQEGGSILSFGLNVGGYQECDARLDPAQVLDGQWHHCAATFDGKRMRVYLDGKEIDSLERPGKIATRPDVPAFIGSSSGTGEHFQGGLDDLRVYATALSAQQVARLHQDGTKALARRAEEMEERLAALYPSGKSFAETLASCRENVARGEVPLDRDLADALVAKLRTTFPEDCAHFTEWTGVGPLEYLIDEDRHLNARHAERLIGLLLEYKPLTEHQRNKQTAEDRARWAEADRIASRFEALKARGDAAADSPEWIEVMLAAGERIEFRPYRQEAVAPYRKPETPETRTLTAEEAREVLERDWLHQAGGKPTPERIKQEIEWTRALAARIASHQSDESDMSDLSDELAELAKQADALTGPDRDLYFRVRELKRKIAFANPAVDFGRVLFVDMPFPQGSEWRHETRHRLGYQAVPGGRLLVLDGLSPEGRLTQLMPQAPLHGSFWRPDVSWDAQKVLFCFKPHNEKSFHLYEINVDGSGLVQLTDGPYDDFDPIYLPDGEHLLFSTTRGNTYVRCMPPTNAFILARCDRDGKNVYLVSQNNEPDYLPSVMHDGRVLYTRWEYTDKPLWRAQALWTVNPDGTGVQTFWGNQSVWPDLLKDARSIPGSQRVMFTGSAHHNWFSGSVGLIDPTKGFNFPDGLTKVTADVGWPESGNGPVDPIESPNYHSSGAYSAYYSPYPLSEQDFLVSANRGGKFVLYLMDVDGNRELIYEGAHNIFHAIPLKPRTKPPVIMDRVDWPSRAERLAPKDGLIFSGNVYQGAPAQLRGKAKFLRVLNIEPKTYTYWHKRPYLSTGPVVSSVQSEGVKRIVGTVPIEADGSVAFYAPSGQALHFQLLDERHRALQTMRSFVGVMPGERRGCLGCHESHSRAPITDQSCSALNKEPQQITPPEWEDTTVSYERYVQPVLDKYCGSCHQGNGKAREKLDLTDRPGALGFSDVYWTLIGRPSWGAPYQPPENPPPGFGIADMLMVEAYDQRDPQAYCTPKPMTRLSYKSRLIERASSGKHHGVKVDERSLRRLIAWVDTMCPYRGDEEVRAIPDPEFQGVDWIAVRPRIATAPRIVRPGPVD